MNTDVYNRVTDKIIVELEKGERPWMNRGTPNTPPEKSPARSVITACPIPVSIPYIGCKTIADNSLQPKNRS